MYVSWSTKSKEEFARSTPVNPPTVNKNTNPTAQIIAGDIFNSAPYSVPIQLKTLMPVGTAITIVAVVKYARVSVSINCKYVVGPHNKPKHPNCRYSVNYPQISKGIIFTSFLGNNLGDKPKSRQNQNVDFRVPKKSE